MLIDVVGIEHVEYDKKDGTHVNASNLFAFKEGGNNIKGMQWLGIENKKDHTYKPLFVVASKLDPDLAKLGKYEIEFNIYGGIENIAYIGK